MILTEDKTLKKRNFGETIPDRKWHLSRVVLVSSGKYDRVTLRSKQQARIRLGVHLHQLVLYGMHGGAAIMPGMLWLAVGRGVVGLIMRMVAASHIEKFCANTYPRCHNIRYHCCTQHNSGFLPNSQSEETTRRTAFDENHRIDEQLEAQTHPYTLFNPQTKRPEKGQGVAPPHAIPGS